MLKSKSGKLEEIWNKKQLLIKKATEKMNLIFTISSMLGALIVSFHCTDTQILNYFLLLIILFARAQNCCYILPVIAGSLLSLFVKTNNF